MTANSLLSTLSDRLSSFIRTHGETRLGSTLMLGPALLTVFLLMVVPALLLIRYSFLPFEDGAIGNGFTLDNYRRIGSISLYLNVTIRTVRIAVAVTVFSFLLAFPLAYTAVRKGGLLGRIIVLSAFAPLTIDLVIRSFGWYALLSTGGLVQSALVATPLFTEETAPQLLYNELSIIIGMTHVILPFVVFPIVNVLHTIPPSLEEAARDLGANRLTVFRTIIFPLALPGIAAGLLMAFLLTMAAYVTPAILGGRIEVLPTIITSLITGSNNWPFASALSIILIVVAIVIIVAYHHVRKHIVEGVA
ncbi:ABC transporter permease [Natrialbaceae archaeon A-chndr2]|uniref:ABC transporter permease n=1 Tax=Natronosalvus amylolyticus TaxID=2961994 RepID=UPI0020CA0BAF|nr:ABC transporter permease [Natronosalvus amylolyticus]